MQLPPTSKGEHHPHMYDVRHAHGGYVTATNADERMVRAGLLYTQATEVEKKPFRLKKVRIVKIDSGLVSWRTTSVINHGSHKRVYKLSRLVAPSQASRTSC